jgi:hypothetical protein
MGAERSVRYARRICLINGTLTVVACCGPASVHRLSLQLAVKAELSGKATTEEVKGMQRDMVVQLWSNRACPTRSPSGSPPPPSSEPRRHLPTNTLEALIGCNQLGREE